MGCKINGSSLFAAVLALIKFILPNITQFELEQALLQRSLSFESEVDLEHLLSLEDVLDCFDPNDVEVLKKEIESAKEKKSRHKEYNDDYRQFKVI